MQREIKTFPIFIAWTRIKNRTIIIHYPRSQCRHGKTKPFPKNRLAINFSAKQLKYKTWKQTSQIIVEQALAEMFPKFNWMRTQPDHKKRPLPTICKARFQEWFPDWIQTRRPWRACSNIVKIWRKWNRSILSSDYPIIPRAQSRINGHFKTLLVCQSSITANPYGSKIRSNCLIRTASSTILNYIMKESKRSRGMRPPVLIRVL